MGTDNSVHAENDSSNIIKQHITDLTGKDGVKRQKARNALVAIGKEAIEELSGLLVHTKDAIRWEAVKALAQIKDPLTAPHLVQALADESEGIRWMAAEGLVSLHKHGLMALLHVLSETKHTVLMRVGAHHVVKTLAEQYDFEGKTELLAILENKAAHLDIPVISKKVLENLIHDPQGFRYNI